MARPWLEPVQQHIQRIFLPNKKLIHIPFYRSFGKAKIYDTLCKINLVQIQ
jgi:hypothetical protein